MEHKRALLAHGQRVALVAGTALVGGCGATVAVASTAASDAGARRGATGSPATVSATAIPLGDGHVSTTPRVGYVDSCLTQFRGGGAAHDGPWIDTQTGTWNSLTKPAVEGAVSWPTAYYRVRVSHGKRIVTFNDLPVDHTSGVFPISSSDPAYAYDHNPNHIAARSMRWSLPLDPAAASRPSCTRMGAIGVLDDGVLLFNALDAAGRDAGAHEIQDRCGAHPDGADEYHHHTIPSCILDKAPNGTSTLVGYALDGYGIYVQKSKNGALPTNAELDACHGTTSRVLWNGKLQRVYHYVATLEYPYSVGCFHGTPITVANNGGSGGVGRGGAGGRGGGGPGGGGPGGGARGGAAAVGAAGRLAAAAMTRLTA